MAYIKKTNNKLQDLKDKWKIKDDKKAAMELRHQVKLDKIQTAIDQMCDDNIPKTMENLILHSGICRNDAQRLFTELYGTTVAKYFKHTEDNPWE